MKTIASVILVLFLISLAAPIANASSAIRQRQLQVCAGRRLLKVGRVQRHFGRARNHDGSNDFQRRSRRRGAGRGRRRRRKGRSKNGILS